MTDDNKPAAPAVTYAQAGVDIDAGNAFVEAIKPHIRRTSRTGVMGTIGGFGGLFDLKSCGYRDPVLVAANDGVGTKLKLAFEMDLHHTVGIDLVAMSVNDLVVQGAEPLFFLDYFATGKLALGVAERVIAGIAEGCQTAGCALIGGETAEMPGMYSTGEYDLAGFAVGAVERDRVLPRADVGEGDVLIGLASTGPHSNGYSLIRKLVADSGADLHQPLPQSGDDTQLGERLLTPTRIYVRSLLGAIRELGSIKALAHITGGGLTENIPRVLPDGCGVHIELDDWPRRARLQPGARAAFHWIHTTGRLEQAEMVRTFNCGVGMVAIAAEAEADRLLQWFEAAGETAFPLGRVTRQHGDHRVTYSGRLGFGA